MNGTDTIKSNAIGEIKGISPIWSCDQFAEYGHDYFRCRVCWNNYEKHLETKSQGAAHAEQ
jgi:hypothetical protein